jgi:C1A family cysteine protease
MTEKQGVPLSNIVGFPETALSQLAELWITTAEELVSAATQTGGLQGLAEHLGLSEDEVTEIVNQAVAILPDEVSFGPEDPTSFGLGALDEQEGKDPDDEPASFAPLPGQVDLHDRFPAVRNQGNRGTCVAHACAAVREFLQGENSTSSDLSEQFLYWDCKERDGHVGSGTWIRVGMECLKEDGVCTEQAWPYNPQPIADNEGQGPPPGGVNDKAKAYRVTGSEKLEPRWVNNLRETLAEGLPIAFSVPVYTFWFAQPTRRSGDIRMPLTTDHNEGGHAMCMVGYEDDHDVPGGGFFLVRNSWGTDRWGADNIIGPGYARIPYAYISQYGRAAYTARIKKDEKENKTGGWSFISWLKSMWERIFG